MFRAKSEMILTLAKVSHPERYDELEALLKKINKSANKRNSYVHNTWAVNEKNEACMLYYVPPNQMEIDPIRIQDIKQLTAQVEEWNAVLFKFL